MCLSVILCYLLGEETYIVIIRTLSDMIFANLGLLLMYFSLGHHVRMVEPCLLYNCRRQKPSSVQIYIGKAGKGIVRRWLVDRWAHCLAVRDVLEAKDRCSDFAEMATVCEHAKLADCYLAMALLRDFPTALFVIRECEDASELSKLETDLIYQHAAKNMQHGLNCR